ncbi:DUF3021 family protein [Enterococcus sp. HY326]|uniref:DUF3021 family protein n=1 Tax=Enterococcus sp. HY326 TaxID=2971265 RepID=UPI00223EF853|nr:DUF3021 family protein [Enterococcus sp. HY326]
MNKKVINKILSRFFAGIIFASIIFAILRLFHIHTEPLTIGNVVSVLFLGGCSGQLTGIFDLEINFSFALLLHFLCTMLLTIFIFLVNGWQDALLEDGLAVFGYFFISYLFVWLVLKILQRRKISKINRRLQKNRTEK